MTTTYSNQSKNSSTYTGGTKNTSTFTNQSKSTSLDGYVYNGANAYNDANYSYNFAIGYTTYSNQSKTSSTFTNQTPSMSTWSNLSKN